MAVLSDVRHSYIHKYILFKSGYFYMKEVLTFFFCSVYDISVLVEIVNHRYTDNILTDKINTTNKIKVVLFKQ